MKIKDILKEDVCDVVARFYKEASADSEKFYNPEVVKYQNSNKEYYEKYFEDWRSKEQVPVFTKPVDKPQKEYNPVPQGSKLQSPGYRGLQYALAAAGLPYNHEVQRYRTDPAMAIATQTMDSANNSSGR